MIQLSKKQPAETDSPLADGGLLLLRLGVGGLLAGHGAQKLLGWFGGHGLEGTGQWLESTGLRPGKAWAMAAAAGELGGGLLTALGLANPLGPIGVISAMSMATAKAHWGKPIWVTSGGAELPAVNSTAAAALALAGPGRYSLDRALGLRLPWWAAAAAAALAGAAVLYGAMQQPQPSAAGEGEATAPAEEARARPESAESDAAPGERTPLYVGER